METILGKGRGPCGLAMAKEMSPDGRAASQRWAEGEGTRWCHWEPGEEQRQLQTEDVVGLCGTLVSQRSTAALLTPSRRHPAPSRMHCLIVLLSPYCLAALFALDFFLP